MAAAAGCGGKDHKPPQPAAPEARGPVLRFSFEGVDGRPISTEAFANRISVIAFLTTYDVHSQVVARFLASLAQHHSPRINAAALMLEAPENRPLIEAFVTSMGLHYPVAMADAATIAGEGPFAGLHHVPSVVILDRQGREAYRHVGFMDEAAMEGAVKMVEKSSPPPQEPPAQ
ncbi:MAG: TlpA disulfide reductase family protein [Minicystis sp.]